MVPNYTIDKLERNRNVSLTNNKCCDLDKELARSCSNEIHFNPYDFKINIIEIIFSYCLTRLNLSGSNLFYMPEYFCKLTNLKECHLSQNNIREISVYISNFQFLHTLHLDSNKISLLPAFLNDMPSLIELDVYDNQIETAYCNLELINCLDIAMNFIDEPETQTYQFQKRSLRERLGCTRVDGCKSWTDYIDEEDDDKFSNYENYTSSTHNDNNTTVNENFEEEERWDSDEWTPDSIIVPRPSSYTLFDNFVARLMRQGHFCPVDAHVGPVPKSVHNFNYESGQFDDA